MKHSQKVMINITLTKEEYAYLKEICVSTYVEALKIPTKTRTKKFYVLESLVKHLLTE